MCVATLLMPDEPEPEAFEARCATLAAELRELGGISERATDE